MSAPGASSAVPGTVKWPEDPVSAGSGQLILEQKPHRTAANLLKSSTSVPRVVDNSILKRTATF